MKIAVNTRLLLSHKLEGIGWFTYEVLKRLTNDHPEVEWIFIFDRPYDPQFIFSENVTPVVMGPPSRHPVLWYLWFEWSIPKVLKKHKPDLFLSPDGYLSLRAKVKSLTVIHDLNFEHHREMLPTIAAKYYCHYFPKFAHKANRIATVSEYSKTDIVDTYGISPNKVDVVYNGCGDFFFPLTEPDQDAVRNEITGGASYFIFVGALNPRKNITGMLESYSRYRNNGGLSKFVIVGEKMFWTDDIALAYKNHPFKNDIVFTGRLEGAGLNRVLASSAALLFVSNFEGFGIPIVEAFKCNIPVITSTATSMPEIAGDAAILCNPGNFDQIAKAMADVEKKEIREDLVAKGAKRTHLFTWEKSAANMWLSIQKTLEENGKTS